jgi:NitT/TauT family transport system permease protein
MSSEVSTLSASPVSLTRTQKVRGVQFVVVALILGFIEFAPQMGLVGRTTLIPLSEMVDELVALLVAGDLTPHIIQTFTAVFGAFLLAVAVGVPAGVVLWRVETLKEVLDPYLLIYYAVPFFAFYPLLISLLGLGILPILTIAWGFSVVIIVTNTASGLTEIPEEYVLVGRDLNLSGFQMLRHVYLPAAVPYVFTGLKLGFVYALIGTIASEFILADSGLGWLISYAYNNFDVRGMYASMLLVVLLALTVNAVLVLVERRLHRRAEA